MRKVLDQYLVPYSVKNMYYTMNKEVSVDDEVRNIVTESTELLTMHLNVHNESVSLPDDFRQSHDPH